MTLPGLRKHEVHESSPRATLISLPVRVLLVSSCLLALAGLDACRATAPAPAQSPHRPVIFLGLDAADWPLLDTYMSRGLMPNLAKLAQEGTGGRLKTISPPLSPLVW